MRRQFRTMGAMFDWDAEVVTCEPEYYRWNQWLFLQFLEAGLAYRRMSPVDWCPNDGTLAREQVEGVDRHCWRCGAPVEKRDLDQWYLRTTKYADELLDFSGHRLAGADPAPADELDRPVEGAEVVVHDRAVDAPRRVARSCASSPPGRTRCSARRSWSSRPEHPLVATLTAPDRRAEVEAYVAQAAGRTEIERLSTDREKTGVALGADAINPVNGERIPIWIADYVLAGYGTGAIMAVPAHDERDFAFAHAFGLPIRRVVAPAGDERSRRWPTARTSPTRADERPGRTRAAFSGLAGRRGRCARIVGAGSRPRAAGKPTVTYRLRDWLFSRQRYWGTPIPVIYCERDGIVPVPEDELPVLLPDDVDYGGTRREPAEPRRGVPATSTCPSCGGPARRETDTMDTFMDSSWYWFRYLVAAQGRRPDRPRRWSTAGRRSTSTPAAPSTP